MKNAYLEEQFEKDVVAMRAETDPKKKVQMQLDILAKLPNSASDMLTSIFGTPGQKKPSIESVQAEFRKQGLEVTGEFASQAIYKTTVVAWHDGVPYAMEVVGNDWEVDPKRVAEAIATRALLISRYHPVIKAVYEYHMALGAGDFWAWVSNSVPPGVWFDNHTGHVSNLSFDRVDYKGKNRVGPDGYWLPNKTHKWYLQVNWKHNNVYFKGKFDMPGIKLALSGG
jgi:hypothetical protein